MREAGAVGASGLLEAEGVSGSVLALPHFGSQSRLRQHRLLIWGTSLLMVSIESTRMANAIPISTKCPLHLYLLTMSTITRTSAT